MAIIWDPIYALNFTLTLIIFLLGFWGYNKNKNKTSLYLGIAFFLFWLSHLTTLLGYKASLESILIIIRTIAYLTVLSTVYKLVKK